MAFVVAGIVAIGTLLVAAVIAFANGMSDAPTERGVSLWPTLIVGLGIAALIAGSHWVHFSW